MSLKDAINNTNTQKENIKTVANNIDNKLVELGGEKATDLSDVANKMEGMVGQYKKFATGDLNYKASLNSGQGFNKTLPIDFPLKYFFIEVTKGYNSNSAYNEHGVLRAINLNENQYVASCVFSVNIQNAEKKEIRIVSYLDENELTFGKWWALG